MAEGLQCQLFAHRCWNPRAGLPEGSENRAVLILENNIGMILRRTSPSQPPISMSQSRHANSHRIGDGFTEGIEVDNDKINQRDLLLIKTPVIASRVCQNSP